MTVLSVDRLAVSYATRNGSVEAVRDASLTIERGETVALVGESGSGKSTIALATLGLLGEQARIGHGSIALNGRELVGLDEAELRKLRGVEIGYVPQDPLAALNPVQRIGAQVAETLVIHGLASGREAQARALEAMEHAGLRQPDVLAKLYPHELSGGMRQRVLIASAMVARPGLIVADEPTSALDVTVQRQILDQLELLKRELGLSILFITHDLALAAQRAARVVVLQDGNSVEHGPAADVLTRPRHPYSKALVASAPRLRGDAPAAATTSRRQPSPPLLRVEGLVKEFALRGQRGARRRAVDGVSFTIGRGETLGLVGESGSGKTTAARIVLRLLEPSEGTVAFGDQDLLALRGEELRQARRHVQPIFQDPLTALDPRFSVEQTIAEPLRAFRDGDRQQRRARVRELLDAVRLPEALATRRSTQLSGGQRQRVAIARALALRPDLVVCDEIVSALDVSVQAQILSLLGDLQRDLGVSLLFISHDLAVVRSIAHRVCVMSNGAIVEEGDSASVLLAPAHPYTQALVDAVPDLPPADQEDQTWTSVSSTLARR
ncbi:MAG TPA: ABC transporter ATP-binding protein [Solirubrobacteraceae bacterium]|nr:ABC transporter ATP-binding protein [Solirubrobacteraceae bacterium]